MRIVVPSKLYTDYTSLHLCSGVSYDASHRNPSLLKPLFWLRTNALLPLSVLFGQALDRLVTVSSIHYCTSTSALSTSSSSRGLTLSMGYLILRGASRLDAFSVYPFPTWLPGPAIGITTGTPEVSPSRSSRTKDSSSQISCAHAG